MELPVLRLNHPASATTSSWRKRTFFRTSKNSRPPDVLLARTNKLFLQASQRREIATFILSSNVFVEEATSANFETSTASVSSSLEGTSNGLDTPYLVTKESVWLRSVMKTSTTCCTCRSEKERTSSRSRCVHYMRRREKRPQPRYCRRPSRLAGSAPRTSSRSPWVWPSARSPWAPRTSWYRSEKSRSPSSPRFHLREWEAAP